MTNKLHNFDQAIKDSFDGFEPEFNQQHWDDLQADLDASSPSLTSYFGAITTGLVATSVVFIAMLFFSSDANLNGKSHKIVDEKVIVAEGLNPSSPNTTEMNAASANEEANDSTSKSNENNLATENQIAENAIGDSENKKSENSNANIKKSTTKKALPVPVKTIKSKSTTKDNSSLRTGCTGLVINFDASEEYGADAKYLWNFGDGFFSNESSPSHTFNKEGVFDVSLSVTSKTTGQISSNVVQAMIEVAEAPVANMVVEIASPKTVKVKNDSYNASELAWHINSESIVDKNEIEVSVADNTRQKLTMAVTNNGGCTDTLETIINSVNAGSEFPRALGQSFGANFAPGAILDGGDVTSIKIFQKSSGNLVFEGSGNAGWNGSNTAGQPANKGAYVWLMAVKKAGVIDIYKGNIELR